MVTNIVAVFQCTVIFVNIQIIGLDKRGYQVNYFLVSQKNKQTYIASLRRF